MRYFAEFHHVSFCASKHIVVFNGRHQFLVVKVFSFEDICPAAGLVFLQVSICVFQALSSWLTSVVSSRVNNEIRQEIYSHIISAEWEDIGAFHSGDLLNRLEGDASTVSSGVIGFVPSVFTRSAQFFGSFAIVFYYDKTMAFLALMSAPFLFFSSRFLLKNIRKKLQDVLKRFLCKD